MFVFFPCCSMEFLSKSSGADGPLVAFGGSDGVIRVLSMLTWKVWDIYLLAKFDSIIKLLILILSFHIFFTASA